MRLVLVAGLAAVLAVGSVAAGPPAGVAAEPKTCEQALNIGNMYQDVATTMYHLGDMELYRHYQGRADAYLDNYYPCV